MDDAAAARTARRAGRGRGGHGASPHATVDPIVQAAELVLIGYNTPIHYAPDPSQDELAGFKTLPGSRQRSMH